MLLVACLHSSELFINALNTPYSLALAFLVLVFIFARLISSRYSKMLPTPFLGKFVDDPFAYLDKIKNAGSIFLGKNCPEALGDYFAGPNHTLPTSGTARFYSALSVDDFTKRSQYSYYTAEALDRVADKIARFAEQEGLHGHAKSVLIRREQKNKENGTGTDIVWH